MGRKGKQAKEDKPKTREDNLHLKNDLKFNDECWQDGNVKSHFIMSRDNFKVNNTKETLRYLGPENNYTIINNKIVNVYKNPWTYKDSKHAALAYSIKNAREKCEEGLGKIILI